jgi:hypothetical protein
MKKPRLAEQLEELQLRALKNILDRIAAQMAATLRPVSNAPDRRPDSVLTTRPTVSAKRRGFLTATDGLRRGKKGKNPGKTPRTLA